MTVPEVILYRFLTSVIKITNDDYNAASDKTKSFLGLFFSVDDSNLELSINTFNFFEQAVAVFIKNNENVRKIEINLGYNLVRGGVPTVHILLPSERGGEFTGLGLGEGYQNEEYDDTTNKTSSTHTSTFQADYNIMLTSDNSSEIILMYNFFKGMFELFNNELELMGLMMSEVAGGDVQFNSDLVPPNIFHRNLILSFKYESSYKKLFEGDTATKLKAQVCSDFYLDFMNNQNKDILGVTKA